MKYARIRIPALIFATGLALSLSACADGLTPVAPTANNTSPALQQGQHQQVNLTFEKTQIDPNTFVWEGTASGDIAGDLRTELDLETFRVTGSIWQVQFDWIITADDPSQSFTAELSGTLNTKTGAVVMNGVVVEGYLEGAQVHEEGQLLGVENGKTVFGGSIRIMAGSGGR